MLNAARLVIVASTLAAALAEAFLATPYHPFAFWIPLAAFIALLVYGDRLRGSALPVLAAVAYLTPAFFIAIDPARQADFSLDIVWVLPLLGLSLSGNSLHWSLPQRMRAPLITWALVVAVSWPIVFLRETDFALWVLPLPRVSNASTGFSPWQVNLSVTYFVLLHNAGILAFDALCRWFARDRHAFRREVLKPMAIAATVAVVVAFYQGFVDLGFLNQKFWEYMIRAAGTLGDPNKLGAVISFWTLGALLLVRRIEGRWSSLMSLIVIAVGVGTVWLSGSRTGLAAVSTGLSITAVEAARHWWSSRRAAAIDLRKASLFAGGAVAAAAVMVVLLQGASTHTIVARGTLGYMPIIGDRGIVNSANELLWERFGYGPAAIEMVKEHPIQGVGVGTFHMLVTDYGRIHNGIQLAPDNAQNWWRHNIAELGLLGVIPVFWWCIVFARLMFSASPSGDRVSIAILRAAILGFVVASIFGMPAQSIAIVMTFWVFAFWLMLEKGLAAPEEASTARDRRWLIAAFVLAAIHAGATTVDAFGPLRPLERAKRWDWYYRYGWVFLDKDIEADPGGNPVGRRWTMKKSLTLIPVKGRALKFVAWVDHPDSDQKPVHTRVWADNVLIYEGNLRRGTPLLLDIPPRRGEKYLVLETEIDRLFRPSDFNPISRDRRELGLSVRDWVWQ